jgi:hypothetical protein
VFQTETSVVADERLSLTRMRAGTKIVPPLLTFGEIGKCSNSTLSITREGRGRSAILLEE